MDESASGSVETKLCLPAWSKREPPMSFQGVGPRMLRFPIIP